MLQESKKIFISYSWKPYTHKLKVIELAERLTNDGIHVILDDWDLKEGQDKYHFMEQMVNDDSVNKVLFQMKFTLKLIKLNSYLSLWNMKIANLVYQLL